MDILLRPIEPTDAASIAEIHTQSWRTTYRGTLRDAYLDGGLAAERLALWRGRLNPLAPRHIGSIAFAQGDPVGFAWVELHADPVWGMLLDNLHVRPDLKGHGIGRRLLESACRRAAAVAPTEGLFLWVYEANVDARTFYERLGAEVLDRVVVDAPGGGQVAEFRYSWPTVGALLDALREAATHGALRR